jgi:mono/diheme cytochrome c family protein
MRLGLALFCLLAMPWTPVHAEDLDKGKQLFEFKCGLCHQVPDPAKFKPAQWREVLQTMQGRMKQFGMPPLTEEEHANVLAYIIAKTATSPENSP